MFFQDDAGLMERKADEGIVKGNTVIFVEGN